MLKINLRIRCRVCGRRKWYKLFRVNTNGRQMTCRVCTLRKKLMKILAKDRGMIHCFECRSDKPPELFFVDRKSKTGRMAMCKKCYRKRKKLNANNN